MKDVTTIRQALRAMPFRNMLLPLLLAVVCPMMAHADGDVGVKVTVCDGTTDRESAQFKLSKTIRISLDNDGKVVMKLGDSDTNVANVAELPIKNGAELHMMMQDYDESKNKLAVTISEADYSTLYSAFQMTVPSGVEVYAPVYDADRNVLRMNSNTKVEEGTVLPAATGIVLKNQGDYNFAYSDAEPAQVNSALSGSVVSAPVEDFDGSIYSLAKENETIAFYKYAQPTTVAGKAFLVLPNTQQAKQVAFAFDDIATNIDATPGAEHVSNPTYNLAGQQVGNSYRGIIIQNGKKIRR